MNRGRTSLAITESRGFDRRILWISLLLVALVFAVFGQTMRHAFINYDDQEYVFGNAFVVKGLTLPGIRWAFHGPHSFNWHPLTSISHMLDCQVFGLNAGGHHLTSVLLHALGAALLFVALTKLTDQLWPSAFVALLFAIHPLRAESVAWIAERKDVLSGVFFFLTLLAYAHYVRTRTLTTYLLVALALTIGLMCKPMLVTTPLVLLVLDYWPLGRLFPAPDQTRKGQREAKLPREKTSAVLLEKLPLVLLSIGSSIATIIAQGSAVVRMEQLSFSARLLNALASYGIYIWQLFVPRDLTLLYPLSLAGIPVTEVIISGIALLLITGAAFRLRARKPHLLAGWLWYLGMLFPVIGLVQVGSQGHADRYTYLPHIGLLIMIVWTAVDLSRNRARQTSLFAWSGGLIALVLALLAWKQTSYWQDSETVWTHAIAINPRNETAVKNLGDALLQKDKFGEAIVQYTRALQLNPRNSGAENGLGSAYLRKGNTEQAVRHYQKAAQLRPEDPEIHNNLGNALCDRGSLSDGIAEYRRALQLRPDQSSLYNAETLFNLGNALLRSGQIDEALVHFRTAVQIAPNESSYHSGLGTALMRTRAVTDALRQFGLAVQLDPRSASAKGDYAWALATSSDPSLRNGPKAVELAEQARGLTQARDPLILRTLAAAYAETRDFASAVKTAEAALALARERRNLRLEKTLERELALYQRQSPYQNPGSSP